VQVLVYNISFMEISNGLQEHLECSSSITLTELRVVSSFFQEGGAYQILEHHIHMLWILIHVKKATNAGMIHAMHVRELLLEEFRKKDVLPMNDLDCQESAVVLRLRFEYCTDADLFL